MKGIILALAIFSICVESRISVEERQWDANDVRQDNCTEICENECQYCKHPETCGEDEFKCGEEAPEVGPDCPANEICVPSDCECQKVGTDGEKCPLICPPDCTPKEKKCPGDQLENQCMENDYCILKGVATDGSTCPGYCPKECEDEEIKCPSPNDPITGCDVEPSCIPKQTDNHDNICSFQQCPLICNATQHLCHGAIDHQGCKEADKCITKDVSDSGELCPGTCPVDCEPDEVLCPGQVDYNEGPTQGCVGQDECKPKAKDMNGEYCPDESASHDCPVTCPPDEILCLPGDGVLGCKLAAECSPKTIGNNGTYCPTHSDCPTVCTPHEVNCPDGDDDNGCKNPDLCIAEVRDTKGDLCTVHCPIECEDNEVLCPGQRDEFGCVEADQCITRPIKEKGSDAGGLCPGWCPPKCEHDELLCPSQIDPCDGCPTEEICVVAETDLNGVDCPGKDYPAEHLSASHGCPRICDDLQGYMLCPVSEDESGCKPQAECKLKDLDNTGQWCNEYPNCPVQCKHDEIMCHNGKDPRGCNYRDSCLPRGNDKDGNLCVRVCPMQCDLDQLKFCQGGILPNGCFEPDFCVERTSDNNGDLCSGVCPPHCLDGEVIEVEGEMDYRGCPRQATCVPATSGVMYLIMSEFVVEGINPDNFAQFQALLSAAVAAALGVDISAVTLSLENPAEMDRMYGMNREEGLIITVTIQAVGVVNKASLMTKMDATSFKSDINKEVEHNTALKSAHIAVQKIKGSPIATYKTIENPREAGSFIPEVVIPGSDVLPPGIGNDVLVLKKEGESCGSCMCPPTYTAGECEQHLECVHNPMIADAPGTCLEPIFCCKSLDAVCQACEARLTIEEFCSYPMNAHVSGCQGPPCANPNNKMLTICPFGSECCSTCDEQGQSVESGECESTLNGNPGCPMVDCLPIGEECGKTFCSPGTECCIGCDGPTGTCELTRDNGGFGCPVVDCLPPGAPCGTVICQFGGECCMTCDEEGNLVPADHCAEPSVHGMPGLACPLVRCEAPVTAEPPIIVDPPVFCCEAIMAECEACKKGMTVDAYCKDFPKMDGCTPSEGDQCLNEECGTPCEDLFEGMGPGICDGNGLCVSQRLNPCAVHGCEGKQCGETCLMGDIMGWCDASENCEFSPVECDLQLSDCLQECKEIACSPDLDLANGCNQMYSCSHGCKIRALGVEEDACKEHCNRDGRSGCSPNVEGYQFELCGVCTREGCSTYPTIDECEIGCMEYGKVSQLDKCLGTCKDEACATDLDMSKGCNQMYSCSHGCKIRQLGFDVDECHRHCNRNGESGCTPAVKGYEFALCGVCTRENCEKYPTVEECETGCNAYGTCEWNDMDGNCIDHCFGAFAVHLNEKDQVVCGCKGDECNEDPCNKCKVAAEAKGMTSWSCPCPNLE